MNRIAKVFKSTKPFISYITGGDGGLHYSVDCALALVEGGVDILEIGFPFSDPVADGPVIQRAHQRALEKGTTSSTLLEIARRLRRSVDTPMVLFSYFNPIFQRGESYLQELKSAGFDGVLIVDLPVSAEPDSFFCKLKHIDLLPIVLATPSSDAERLHLISQIASGFLYYVSQKGTTGVRHKLADDFVFQMTRLRHYFHIPIVAGFGIADRSSAKAALEHADGFVVGSALVKKMEENCDPREFVKFAQSIDPRLS